MMISRLQFSLLLASLFSVARTQVRVPPYFNVALDKPIWATSSCGQSADGTAVREQYCQLTLTREAHETTCGFCDGSRSDEWHPIQFAVDGSEKWWQSPPLSRGEAFHEVNITVGLGQVWFLSLCIRAVVCMEEFVQAVPRRSAPWAEPLVPHVTE